MFVLPVFICTLYSMIKLLLLIIVLIIGYAYCYFVFPKDLHILQTSVRDFDFNLLQARQPLVVQDAIPNDMDTLIKSWFSPNIVKKLEQPVEDKWKINTHKFLLVHVHQDTELLLYQAGHKIDTNGMPSTDEPIIAIKMKEFQSVIIPYRWHYHLNKECNLYGIHDYVTYVIDILI